MGLTLAEAQTAGACVVHSPGQAKDEILCPEAAVTYRPGDPAALAGAIVEAMNRDGRRHPRSGARASSTMPAW